MDWKPVQTPTQELRLAVEECVTVNEDREGHEFFFF
jgi:hypothetical protein